MDKLMVIGIFAVFVVSIGVVVDYLLTSDLACHAVSLLCAFG